MRRRRQNFVTSAEAEIIAREIGAKRYMECSALSGEGVDDIFEAATRTGLLVNSTKPPQGCCVII